LPQIPRQPECNIGTSGHVDHGKCLALDEYVLVNGILTTGKEILEEVIGKSATKRIVNGPSLHHVEGAHAISIDPNLKAVSSDCLFYFQPYSGPIYRIVTNTGRSIAVTPEHPLLINREGRIIWSKASEIRLGDCVAFASVLPQLPAVTFPNPLEKLREDFSIVTWEDYNQIRTVTENFTNFYALRGSEFDKLRVIARISKAQLSKRSSLGWNILSKILGGKIEPTSVQRSKLISAFLFSIFPPFSPDEFLVENKSKGRWRIDCVRDSDADVDLVKWLAFVWSRGTSDQTSVRISRSAQGNMFEEFLQITEKKFGLSFKQIGKTEYSLNSKVFLAYLKTKFGFKPGRKTVSPVSSWILRLSSHLRSSFLRWFFTLEGRFNKKTGQIIVAQSNECNIVTIAYLLLTFGIVPRFHKVSVSTDAKQGTTIFHKLEISGRKNLHAFAEQIGFEDQTFQKDLTEYLSSIQRRSESGDLAICVDRGNLEQAIKSCGLLRGESTSKNSVLDVKDSDWYKAYSSARRSGRISRSALLLLIESVEEQLERAETSLSDLHETFDSLRNHMRLMGISVDELALETRLTRKRLLQAMKNGQILEIKNVRNAISKLTCERFRRSKLILSELSRVARSPLEFDEVGLIQKRNYFGYIFDLTVPAHANFIAGNGAIVCHNTTLVQAITGVWTSAHSEELRRGITIKVGYADAAFYKCPNCAPPSSYSTSDVCPNCGTKGELLRVVSFVDCPGHESLMANMLSGAALMDGSVLVIAANEKVPQPQTREHLLALQMLGMKKIVIAQNKVDLVTDSEARANRNAIRNFVAESVASDAPIIPISAQHKLNIDALIEAMEECIPTPMRDPNLPPIMQVLRSFDVNKPGLPISKLNGGVIGGTIQQGKLRVGEEIELRPGLVEEGKSSNYEPITTTVASLGTGAGMKEEVNPGGLIAVGTLLDPFLARSDSLVGSVAGKPSNLPPIHESLTLEVQLFETAVGTADLVKVDKVRTGEFLRLNVGTAVTLGSVSSARDGIAQTKLRKPVCTELGSRVAISRRIGDRWRLIGSGVVK
jgi:translation initiation factor 2 subunit 3